MEKNYFAHILSFFYLFISQKTRIFALVIELERHIEILLLNNDCVIVPNLGGFMTHHIDARYDEGDYTFLPPLRTLGFNPQLKINDSLLAQSYVEAYDISYPEALQRIEDEVNELRMHLQNEGTYELNDIGTLSLNEDGKYMFTPCEAGILTPTLYGLGAFEFHKIGESTPNIVPSLEQQIVKDEPASHETTARIIPVDSLQETVAEEDDSEDVVKIKFSWIRNAVAIAAVLIAVFLVALPTGKTEMMTRTISNLNNSLLFGMMTKDTNTSSIEIKKSDIIKPTTKTGTCSNSTSIRPDAKTECDNKEVVSEKKTGYCIVLASCVTQQNAKIFVEELQKKGYNDTEVYTHRNITRVILGHYETQNEAYNALKRIHKNEELAEAWVYKFQERP